MTKLTSVQFSIADVDKIKHAREKITDTVGGFISIRNTVMIAIDKMLKESNSEADNS